MSDWETTEADARRGFRRGIAVSGVVLVGVAIATLLACAGLVALCLVVGVAGGGG